MALQTSPKAGRKKVRCPKCTALFSEPAEAVFECPICACRLLANGAIASEENPKKEGDSGQRQAVTGSDESIKRQIPLESFSNGNGMIQKENARYFEQREREKQPITEFSRDDTNEQPSVGNTTKGLCRKNGIVSTSPMHCNSEPGAFMNRKERGESLLQLVARANAEAALAITTWKRSSDDSSKENSVMVREESNSIAAVDTGIERMNGVSSNQRLQSQILKTTRCEFSFKYALGGTSPPLESHGELLHQKRSPLLSETNMPANAEASDMPLHTPLRVRISKAHDESSDQSEHRKRSLFDCEIDLDNGSGSDFGFPAPWAESVEDMDLLTSFGQTDGVLPNPTSMVSASPHQLQLKDVYDTIDSEQSTSQQELSKCDAELFSQEKDAGRTIERDCELGDEEPNCGLVQPNHASLWSADASETTISELKPLSSQTQGLYVNDLSSHTSSVMLNDNLDVVGYNAVPIMESYMQKQGGSGLEEVSNVREEKETLKPLDVVVEVLKMNDQCNEKQDSGNAEKEDPKCSPSITDCGLTNLATVPDQEYSKLKPSASTLDHTDNIELEQDLYKLPLEVHGNDSFSGEGSHSALRAEEHVESALSDGTFINASTMRLYHEKRDPHKSSHGEFYGNVGSRLTKSDDDEDHLMPGHGKSLRGLASSQETSLQAASEHVNWKVHIMAAEHQSGHLEMEGKLGPYSQYPVNNSLGFSHANPQSYAPTNHCYGFGAQGTSQICTYQSPSQSVMHLTAFQNHGSSHCGYHAMLPACMHCSYQYHQHPQYPQHPHTQPQHIPPHCGVCFSQSGSMAYNPGLVEHWNCHQAHHGSASSCAGSLVDYPHAAPSTNLVQKHPESKFQALSAQKANQYPPLPKNNAAPYVTCKGCSRVLQVPSDLSLNHGTMQKLRCGACGKVTKFSVNCYDHQRHLVSSTLPLSLGGLPNMPPLVQYGTNSRQLPVSSPTPSLKSSYQHDMLKVNPVLHWSNEVSPQSNDLPASRSSEQNAQGGNRVMDASCNTYGQHDPSISVSAIHVQSTSSVMSPRTAALKSMDSFGFERWKVNPAASFPSTVDEKEEGLDFGAPRISDGDSMDHSESRMRSPEYHQVHEAAHVSQGMPLRVLQPLEQVSDWSEDHGVAAEEKTLGPPLLVLLNQESTRFRLTLEPRVPFEGAGSALSSPASDMFLCANSLKDQPQSHGSPGKHFVSKGPKYIAGLLRRSLRDFGRGRQ